MSCAGMAAITYYPIVEGQIGWLEWLWISCGFLIGVVFSISTYNLWRLLR